MLLVTGQPKSGVSAEENEQEFGQPAADLISPGPLRVRRLSLAEYVTLAARGASCLAGVVRGAVCFYFRRDEKTSQQSASAVVMIRPSRFFPNPETAQDNAFQQEAGAEPAGVVAARALAEFDEAVRECCRRRGDGPCFRRHARARETGRGFPEQLVHHPSRWTDRALPDVHAVAPRRAAAGCDRAFAAGLPVTEVVDYSPFEKRGLYLEGTGSLVLDHVHRLAYVSLSRRADREPLEKFCADFDYEPVTFASRSADGRAIYHTNVMMCLGTEFALVGLEMIADADRARDCPRRLESTGKTIISLAQEQIENFAGNALELHNERGKIARPLRPRRGPSRRRPAPDD